MTYRNPPWWPSANLRICYGDACDDPVFLDYDPDVCERCGIARSEHERGSPIRNPGQAVPG